jgi:undecaprenyl-diphosphatase
MAAKLKPSRVRKLLPGLIAIVFACAAHAQSQVPPAATPPTKAGAAQTAPLAELSTLDAVILGVVEGVTEFLPISSTGHLIIVSRLLNIETNDPLFDKNGEPLWYRKPSAANPAGQLLTMKLASDTYIVVIQFGAIAAVALLYWSQLISMLRGLLGQDPAGLRLLRNVMVAFVPAAGIGFIMSEWITEHLFSVGTVIVTQILGAGLMFFAEYWVGRRVLEQTHRETTELSLGSAIKIGVLQCAALVPGTSRSMMTIVGGYFSGLDPRRSAEFSFLLGFVTLSAASLYKSYKNGDAMIQVFGWSHVALGAAVAAVTAAICVRFLVHWLTRHGLAIFAWYRLALAAALAIYFYL